VNKCYGFRFGRGARRRRTGREEGPVFVLLAAFAVLAFLMGAVSFVTGPVALAMLAGIALWLAVFAGRTALARRGGHHGSR
jgi:hypothetical protein